jgi:hypothetical protein
MMRLRIYIDTSVIGGCLDKEFQNASRQLIDKFKQGEMIIVISELTTLELKDAPQEVRDIVSEKEFDAVKMMRKIRDKLSKEFKSMNYPEQKRYIRERITLET